MKKILHVCVISNSHVAALKQGWDSIKSEYPEISIDFFASPGHEMAELAVSGRRLVPVSDNVRVSMMLTSGGKNEIALDDYDLFVIHALGTGFMNYVQKTINSPELFSEVKEGAGKDKVKNLFKKIFEQAPVLKLAGIIGSSRKKLLISVQPYPAEMIATSSKYQTWHELFDSSGKPGKELLGMLEAWKSVLTKLDYPIIEQPPSTVISGCLTLKQYAIGAPQFPDVTNSVNREESEYDIRHMNREYGVEAMRVLCDVCIKMDTSKQPVSKVAPGDSESVKQHPYVNLPDYAYWRRTVGNGNPDDINDWYRKKFDIASKKIASAGSCFAQHIGRQLRQKGFNYLDVEPAPENIPVNAHLDHGYGMYSARYGNIYTTRQLRQLLERAIGEFVPREVFWEKDGGFVDPFRPTIQPTPFASVDELLTSREAHMQAVRRLLQEVEIFIFTLGLTETWASVEDGAVFPVAPGVSGGSYSPGKYRFVNLGFKEVIDDLKVFIEKARAINSRMKFMFTVSPVPLIATASGQQVVVASTYSKSVLRAVAGQLADKRAYVDYFPSYEIISSHVMGGKFFENDKRSVTEEGVSHVMGHFFEEHVPPSLGESLIFDDIEEGDPVCDEVLLDAFLGTSTHGNKA